MQLNTTVTFGLPAGADTYSTVKLILFLEAMLDSHLEHLVPFCGESVPAGSQELAAVFNFISERTAEGGTWRKVQMALSFIRMIWMVKKHKKQQFRLLNLLSRNMFSG
jgi:hypothetical protein